MDHTHLLWVAYRLDCDISFDGERRVIVNVHAAASDDDRPESWR